MLKKIPTIIPPDLMKYMMEMGHSDRLVITDANFPAQSNSQRYIQVSGVKTDELLAAILEFFPLDNFIEDPVVLMKNRDSEPVPEVWENYQSIIREKDTEEAFSEFFFEERLGFYEAAQTAYCVVQTTDTRRYANIIIQKGVC
jgi:L-fucose mutarotase